MKIPILLVALSQAYNVKNEAFGEIDLMDLNESIFDRIARDTEEGSADKFMPPDLLFTEITPEIEATSTPLVTRTAINLNRTEEIESQKEIKSSGVNEDLVLEESLENEISENSSEQGQIDPTSEVDTTSTPPPLIETTLPMENVTTTEAPATNVTTTAASNVTTTTAAPESAALPLATSLIILLGALLF